MIGTNIRGIRHLFRVSDYSLRKILVRAGEHGFDICEVLKTSPNSQVGEKMFIFNNWFNSHNFGTSTLASLSKEIANDLQCINHPRLLELSKTSTGFGDYASVLTEITLLPKSFDKDYQAFLKENAKMIRNLSDKYGLNPNDIQCKRLYIYTDGSKNFFQWAVDVYFKAHCSMRTIHNILLWNEYYKQLTKKLSKGTITAYTTQSSINDLMEELSVLRNEKRVGDAINEFNTAQKKLLRNNELSDTDKKTLARFSKLSEIKKINFIKKVSTIDDFNELMRQMRLVTSVHFDWNKDSFMDFINNVEGINYKVIFENDYVVLVKVDDYDTIKQLGKTTNWCISKNKTYWNQYVGNTRGKSTQYMIFDFSKLEDDKLSIIGFTTTHNKGITSAHNFINDNLMDVGNNPNATMLKSYLARFDGRNSIYSVLQNCGIDITLVAHYDRPQYQWDYDHFMSYLYECVDKNNVDIIKHDGDKLVLSVRDENIKYLLGDAYMDNISSDDYELQHIIFADFSISQYDSNKLLFAIIYDGGCGEDYPSNVYNESSTQTRANFDGKLIEFGVPYDIIRRTDDIDKKVRNAYTSFNTKILKECIKVDKNCLHRAMREYFDQGNNYSLINSSVIDYLSFDYLDLVYDNGHYLGEYMDSSYIAEILKNLFNLLKGAARQLYRNAILEKPSEERIHLFYDEKIPNRDDVVYVGYYLLIKRILGSENNSSKVNFNAAYVKLLSNIFNSSLKGDLIKEFMFMMLNNLDMSSRRDSPSYIVNYFVRYGDEEMQEAIKNLADKYEWIKPVYETALKTKKEHEDFISRNSSAFVTTANITSTFAIDAPF